MEEVKIRRCGAKDLDLILEFSRKLHEFEKKIYHNYKEFSDFEEELQKFLKKKLRSDKSIFLLAEMNGKPVGMAYGWMRSTFFLRDKEIGYLAEIWVEEKYRKEGIGKRLVEEMLRWFKDKGVKLVRTEVLEGNKDALRFFIDLGFKPVSREMEIKL